MEQARNRRKYPRSGGRPVAGVARPAASARQGRAAPCGGPFQAGAAPAAYQAGAAPRARSPAAGAARRSQAPAGLRRSRGWWARRGLAARVDPSAGLPGSPAGAARPALAGRTRAGAAPADRARHREGGRRGRAGPSACRRGLARRAPYLVHLVLQAPYRAEEAHRGQAGATLRPVAAGLPARAPVTWRSAEAGLLVRLVEASHWAAARLGQGGLRAFRSGPVVVVRLVRPALPALLAQAVAAADSSLPP
jgi:hypothetical protein